jgi:hypothetical protein
MSMHGMTMHKPAMHGMGKQQQPAMRATGMSS